MELFVEDLELQQKKQDFAPSELFQTSGFRLLLSQRNLNKKILRNVVFILNYFINITKS